MNNTIRILIGIVVLAHGVGHILFLIPALGVAEWGQSTRSWLLTAPLGDRLTRGFAALLWLAVILAYIAGVVGYFSHAAWWPGVLVTTSAASLVGLALYWTNPAPSPAVSALIFDLVVILALKVFHWPPL